MRGRREEGAWILRWERIMSPQGCRVDPYPSMLQRFGAAFWSQTNPDSPPRCPSKPNDLNHKTHMGA